MIIDWHCHWLPPDLAEALRARTEIPHIVKTETGERIQVYREGIPATSDLIDIGRRVAFMDRHGVTRQVLSLPGLFGVDSLPAAESAPLVRLFNDAVHALVAEQPDRFSGMAALPLGDLDAAIAELDRSMAQPGMVGAILPADAFLSQADAETWLPILDAANRHKAHLFIHPGPVPGETSRIAPTLLRQRQPAPHCAGRAGKDECGDGDPDADQSSGRFPGRHGAGRQSGRQRAHGTGTHGPCHRPARAGSAAAVQPHEPHLRRHLQLRPKGDCPIFDTERTIKAIRATGFSDTEIDGMLGGNGAPLLKR